ncbi:hypothetical protein [Pantoea agglomerans]|uniref:hypothetical protein n=2 Tax=Pantoea TaxID=53335 RepID=UPI0021654F9E|nr:hypothetical protein [Pantoea agglomerans]UVV71482.1 hypothetical protein NYF24_11545 [Pantoea agglomerans]
MPYKYFIYIITTLAILLSYLTLPGILDQVRNNPQIAYLTAHPDTAFTLFSQCQRKVTDVARCYNAYSAAVALAERHNCSDDGLKLRFRFKRLTEHAADDVIKAELKKTVQTATGQIHVSRLDNVRERIKWHTVRNPLLSVSKRSGLP